MNPGNIPTRLFRQYRIKSRQILLLKALDEHGTLRRAAAAIHTTQPAATALLRQLEEGLDVSLFERHSRGMRPTAYGEIMIRYARGVLLDFEHAIDEMNALASGASGLVRIGSVTGAVPVVLAPALARFKAGNPQVRISILVDTSDILVPELLRDNLDIVLGRLPDQLPESLSGGDLNVEPFGGEPMSIVARAGHAFNVADVTLEDLAGQTWVLHPSGSPMRRRVESALRAADLLTPLHILESASILATTALLEQTDMISVIPRDVARHYAGYGLLAILPIELPITMAQLGIITHGKKGPRPATGVFLRYLRQDISAARGQR